MNDLQNKMLDIYKDISKMCDDNGITYFAIGGTCIGAIRHHGFIPWDDDMDIAIPIEQFDRFLQLAETQLPDYLQLFTCKDAEHFLFVFVKVHDVRTTFIEPWDYDSKSSYKGVYIDVMPIAGIPSPGLKRVIFQTKQRICLSLNAYMRKNYKPRHKLGYLSLLLGKILKKIFPVNLFSDMWIKVMKKNPFFGSEYTGYTWSIYNIKRLVFPTKWFEKTTNIPFEDSVMKCPIGYDQYLRQQFGDYMRLPPEDQREGHHVGVVDLNRSYKDFVNNPLLIKDYINGGNN